MKSEECRVSCQLSVFSYQFPATSKCRWLGVHTTSENCDGCWWGHQQRLRRIITPLSPLRLSLSLSLSLFHFSLLDFYFLTSTSNFDIRYSLFIIQHFKSRRNHTPIFILQNQLMLARFGIYFNLVKLLRLSEIMLVKCPID